MKEEYIDLFYTMYNEEVDKEEFTKHAMDWTFHPITKNKEIVAFIVTKENRIHCACLKEYKGKWFPRKYVNNLFKEIINKYGSVLTSTTETTRDFVERLGFKETGKNGMIINYIKTEV